MGKYIKMLFILVQCVVLIGCWDSVEIEDRAFTYGIAIDLEDKGMDGKFQIRLTNQVIAPGGFSAVNGGGGQEAYRNISRVGTSLYEINYDFLKQANRSLNAQHLQIILMSDELLKEPGMLNKLFDNFIRGREMRRGIKLAVGQGKAKDFFDINPEHIKVPVDYIGHLIDVQSQSETIYPLRIGDIQECLISNISFPIPKLIILDEKNIEYHGVYVFSSVLRKIIGELTPEETEGYNFLTGEINDGTVSFDMDGDQIVIRNIVGKSKLKLKNKDVNNLTFQIDIDVVANLGENYGPNNTYHISKYEKPLEDEIKKIAEISVDKLQQELNTDIIGLNQYLKGFHHKLWKKIKDDWEEGENYFQKSKINVKVNATVENEGNAINTTEYKKGLNK